MKSRRALFCLACGLAIAVALSVWTLASKRDETPSDVSARRSVPKAQGLLVIRIAGLDPEALGLSHFGDLFRELSERGSAANLIGVDKNLGGSDDRHDQHDRLGLWLELGVDPGIRFSQFSERWKWEGESLSQLANAAGLESQCDLSAFSHRSARNASDYPPSNWQRDGDLSAQDQVRVRQAQGFLSQHPWRFLTIRLASGAIDRDGRNSLLRETNTRHLSPRGRSLQSATLVARGLTELAGSNAAICLMAESFDGSAQVVMAGEGVKESTADWGQSLTPSDLHRTWAKILGVRPTHLAEQGATALGPAAALLQWATTLVVALSLLLSLGSWSLRNARRS